MIDLTPETAGASSLAIRIAQRVLELDGMAPVRDAGQRDGSLAAFCAAIARAVDVELNDASNRTRPGVVVSTQPINTRRPLPTYQTCAKCGTSFAYAENSEGTVPTLCLDCDDNA